MKAYRNKYRLLSTEDLCEAAEALIEMPNNEKEKDQVIRALVDRLVLIEHNIAKNAERIKR